MSIRRFAVLLGLLAFPGPAAAQDEIGIRIRESQDRLEEIRDERARLNREATQLRGQVHDVAEEIRNIESRIGTSGDALTELEIQIEAYRQSMAATTREMLSTRDELSVRKVELGERLREIYLRGPLHAFQVLLEARTFGDLLSRYKYLYLVAQYDRTLVAQVRRLEQLLADQRAQLASEYTRLSGLHLEKEEELNELRRLEDRRQRRLVTVRQQATQTENRISALAEEERRLGALMAELERARREAERLSGASTSSALTTSDLGNLPWPVDGVVVYRFGDARADSETPWSGIGIGAPRGTAVRAVQAGDVAWAAPRDLYGPTVIVDHGGGYWSVYLYLSELKVRMGDRVVAGQVIGAVGGDAESAEGEHIEFQILEPGPQDTPRYVDPVRWLQGRG